MCRFDYRCNFFLDILYETVEELIVHWSESAAQAFINKNKEEEEPQNDDDTQIYIGSLEFLKNLELIKNPEVIFIIILLK